MGVVTAGCLTINGNVSRYGYFLRTIKINQYPTFCLHDDGFKIFEQLTDGSLKKSKPAAHGHKVQISVADPDPGSGYGAFLTPRPGSGIRNRVFRIPDPKPIFEELSDNFLSKKFSNSGPNFFFSISKIK
jgi:hypothetical protein